MIYTNFIYLFQIECAFSRTESIMDHQCMVNDIQNGHPTSLN